jgi:hypothetical protein
MPGIFYLLTSHRNQDEFNPAPVVNCMPTLFAFLLSVRLLLAIPAWAQDPSATPPATQVTPAPNGGRSDSSSSKKSTGVSGYLLTGTIFTEKAMAFPGVRIQIRRVNEKKSRWETYTNSRGEFAVRLPEGQEYEVVVRQKHYKEFSLKIKANSGELQQVLSVRLETASQEKDGANK